MPDKPMISKPHPTRSTSSADVLHEALTMRQEAERELAEAGEVRSKALAEATEVLQRARTAAAMLAEESEAEAERTVEQAREQSLGIVAGARDEAEQLLAAAHADVAEFEAWARGEADEAIRREVAGVHSALAARRDDIETRLASLRTALDGAVEALVETAKLPSMFHDGSDPEPTAADADSDPEPVRGVPLMSVVPPHVDVDDDTAADEAPEGGETPGAIKSEAESEDEIGPEVGDPERTDGAIALGASPDASTPRRDDPDDSATVETAEVVNGTDTLVDDDDGLREQEARPLGWLFRSPPM